MVKRGKLAIFDLDGTLFDTKKVNYSAYHEALQQCGLQCNIDFQYYCNFCNGNSYKIFLPQIVAGITKEQMELVHRAKKKIYASYLKFAVMNPFLFSMIDLISTEYNIGLVTTASRQNTEEILEAFSVKNKFDLIITQEDVKHTKPNPEGFILAMRKCDATVEQTIIFEDSDTGICAAKESGAKYVKVYGYN